jgi:hypothetical protein
MPTITLDHWCQTTHIGLLLRGTCQRVSTEDKSISWDATRFIPRHLSAWVNILILNVGLDAAGQVEQAGQTESVLAVVRLELSGQIVCGQSQFTLIPRTSDQQSNRPKSGKDARCQAPFPHHQSLHHHLCYTGRPGKIIFGNQQVALLSDSWRVAEPGADDVKRKLSLEFCLPAGSHRVEQSWPTRDAGASQQSRHLGAQVRVLPAHRCISGSSILWCRDHIFALVPEDLERFIEDRSKFREDRATTNATSFVMLDLWFENAQAVHFPGDCRRSNSQGEIVTAMYQFIDA